MNRYEGMYIFTQAVKTDDVDDAIAAVRAEIEKLGGEVESSTRLGKRVFARPLKKQESGQYAVITFRLDPRKILALQARHKLSEQVLRAQFLRVDEKTADQPAAAAVGEKNDG